MDLTTGHLMADPLPPSYLHIVHNNRITFESLIQHGEVKPVLLWQLVFLTAIPLSALLIPRQKGTRYLRPTVFAIILGLNVEAIRHRRVLLGANGYMIGLIAAWLTIWCGTLLVFHDVEREFQRIERQPPGRNKSERHSSQNGHAVNGGPKHVKSQHELVQDQADSLVWQPYPSSFSHRLNWVLGLLFNMRGPEWNWRISHLDPLPSSVQAQLGSTDKPSQSRTRNGATSPSPNARARLREAFSVCLKSYLLLDLMKVLMMRDPYFWGVVSPPPPPPVPFSYILPSSPSAIRLYRLALTGTGVWAALVFVTSFNPIVFLGLARAFPNASRALTGAPLDAPWLYSDSFGSFLTPVLDHGLAGCWSQWWHQLFRFGFVSTAHWLLSFFPTKIASQPRVKRLVVTFVAFSLSGLIHACGSYTQFAETNPVSGTFGFFFLQAVGVTVQELFAKTLVPLLIPAKWLPRWVCRTANVVFALGWLFCSGSIIADDFARGGLWLTEPLPVSPLRGLGFGLGVEGEGWWCWREPWFGRWDDGSYWGRGVRVM